MRWRRMKRLAWVATWAFWAFLGWRLYAELPRSLGRPVGTLPDLGDEALGFLDNEDTLVTIQDPSSQRPPGPPFVHVRDMTTWAVRSWPIDCSHGSLETAFSSRHGFLITARGPDAETPEESPEALDLRTGHRQRLECFDVSWERELSTHSTHAWAVLLAKLPGDPRDVEGTRFGYRRGLGSRVVVFNLHTGKLICALPPVGTTSEECAYFKPYFLPESDLIALEHQKDIKQNRLENRTLEFWRVPFGRSADREESELRDANYTPSFSNNELMVWQSHAPPHSIEVVDLKTGRILFSDPPRTAHLAGQAKGSTSSLYPGPLLTADGRTLVEPARNRITDIATGRKLWSIGVWNTSFDLEQNLVEVRRPWLSWGVSNWNAWLGARFPRVMMPNEAYSVLDLRTGALLYRCSAPSLASSSDGKWRLNRYPRGVYRVPPGARWPLWTVLQAALAAPLLLGHLVAAAVSRRRAILQRQTSRAAGKTGSGPAK